MRIQTIWALTRILITTVALFALWLIFTFRLDLFSLLAGFIGSLVVALLTYNVFIREHDASRHAFMPRPLAFLLFFFILVYYMYASSIRMLATIAKKNPNPRIVHFRTRLHSDLARMVLANSITFTPGTITLDLNDDHLTVHWFFCNTSHSKAAGEAVKGKMEKHLRKVW